MSLQDVTAAGGGSRCLFGSDWQRFAVRPNSPLEGDGFELPVPREVGHGFQPCPSAVSLEPCSISEETDPLRDRKFESSEPDFLDNEQAAAIRGAAAHRPKSGHQGRAVGDTNALRHRTPDRTANS